MKVTWLVLVGGLLCAAYAQAGEGVREKKIYAHYMGCFPADAGATHHVRAWDNANTRHDSEKDEFKRGGKIRNWPLVPPGRDRLALVQSADLEIRRALRGGIDGFAVDAWAGGDQAKATLDALFQAAKAGDYDFAITIALDPACLASPKTDAAAAAVQYLLDHHGDSPHLARRDGEPLVFGYLSGVLGAAHAAEVLNGTEGWENRNAYRDPEVRNTPAGWQAMLGLYEEIERRVGQDIYFQFGIGAFFHGVSGKRGDLLEAAAYISERMPAVGEFLADGEEHTKNTLAPVVTQNGAEWGEPIHYQYLNFGGRYWQPKGTQMLRERWRSARENNATLIQMATWNDYNENTVLAPGYETRYAVLDLNRHFIDWWKTGEEPTATKDKVYLFWRKYTEGAEVYPFTALHDAANTVLEVVTLLTAPATVRLPHSNTEYNAPAGLHFQQFPLSLGHVKAEIVRDGTVALSLESPEPVTDKPYRQALGLQAISSEFETHWNLDFPSDAPFYAAEYADSDSDGMPDWYEMYWFNNVLLDWTLATHVDPDADLDNDGKTNLEEYLAQTDPTRPPVVYQNGFVWDASHLIGASSTNPDPDKLGTAGVWHYRYAVANAAADEPAYKSFERSYGKRKYFVDPNLPYQAGSPCLRTTLDESILEFKTTSKVNPVALGWQSPVDGTVSLNATVVVEGEARFSNAAGTLKVWHGENLLHESSYVPGVGGDIQVDNVNVVTGDILDISVDGQLFVGNIEIVLVSVAP